MQRGLRETVHVGSAWRLILQDLGLDELSILRRAGLRSTLLEGEGSSIFLDDYYALHDAVEAEANDPALALRAGRVVSLELFDPALFAAICSPDMNTAATRLGQFKQLEGLFRMDVKVGIENTVIHYRCNHRPDVQRLHGTLGVVFLVALARRATRHEIIPRSVTVQRLPEDLAPYNEYLGCALEKGPDFAVVFDARDASRSFLTHNARMWEAFEPAFKRRMAEADQAQSIADRLGGALLELLPSGRTQIKDAAKVLGLGSRTLQRRLAAENTSWLRVLNQTRERLAVHYLRATELSPAEISFLLGFQDPNSFFRAFRRWTGTTPESWRGEL